MQAFAGIVTVSVGHCHPKVVSAVQQQSALLQHTTTIYLNNQIAEYAKELTDRLPGNLKVPTSSSFAVLQTRHMRSATGKISSVVNSHCDTSAARSIEMCVRRVVVHD